ncbi:MAG: helix-turn-helix domain-containing protein [Dongiaceae bacterium]
MDRLGAMRTFRAVVEAGGFSAAARRLGLSKAAVSKQIAELEGHFGTALLHPHDPAAECDRCRPSLFRELRPAAR